MNNIAGKLDFARSYLADIYEEIRLLPEQLGQHTAMFGVSDAIDGLDRAKMSCQFEDKEVVPGP